MSEPLFKISVKRRRYARLRIKKLKAKIERLKELPLSDDDTLEARRRAVVSSRTAIARWERILRGEEA